MAFDEHLVERVRALIAHVDGLVELKMFGGWGVTVHANMAVGVMGDDLIVRVGPGPGLATRIESVVSGRVVTSSP